MYASWRTPSDSYDGVFTRLVADYPERTVERLMPLYFPDKTLPAAYKDWRDAFGKVYADMQVYALERGFASKLDDNGFRAGLDLLRYRIEWRADCCGMPPEWGVTHATDQAIWFWYPGLTAQDKKILQPWNQALANFINGEEVHWGTTTVQEAKRLRSDGETDIWADTMWEEGQHVWKLLNGGGNYIKSRL